MSLETSRKRLRTSHACDSCRARKTRCDGNNPCSFCSSAEQDCTYGSEANSRGKSDIILESVLRVEQALHQLNHNMQVGFSVPNHSKSHLQSLRPSPGTLLSTSPGADLGGAAPSNRYSGSPISESVNAVRDDDEMENAVLESMHTSTTESVLQWPHFDVFPSLRENYVSIFQLEQSRPGLIMSPTSFHPYVAPDEVETILDSFQHNVNFWYPTLSQDQLKGIRAILISGRQSEDNTETCLSFLIMALGYACQATVGLDAGGDLDENEKRRQASKRKMGDLYFESALKKMYVALMSISSTAAHCLFLAALYFATVTRPLQAWEYIRAAAAKCLLLLSYPLNGEVPQDKERIRRIFWSCYILESDYVAELSACPPSGIAKVESTIPLPSSYNTHASQDKEEKSSLYFLACISMRRLLNRVHQLLYSSSTGAACNVARFPYVVAELHHQLDEWREVLPESFSFSLDTNAAENEIAGFLRQRYLTCYSVIYRPYLMWLLSQHPGGDDEGLVSNAPSQDTLNKCKVCLDACLMHIINLRGFAHTITIDRWICSLSMAGAMLALLAACQVPFLRCLVDADVLRAGEHLRRLFESWQHEMCGPISPSVNQSLRIISTADSFIKDMYISSSEETEKSPRGVRFSVSSIINPPTYQ